MSELSNDEQKKLVTELNSISVEAFNKATPIEETWERTINVDFMYLIKKAGRTIGYTTNDIINIYTHEVNYFSSALFRKELQDKGTYIKVNNLRIDAKPANIIMTRTQNPKVVKSFKKLCDERGYIFHPNSHVPEHILTIARGYAPITDEHLICKEVYGRALMDKTPKPDAETKEMFSKIDIERGDAIILIGEKKKNP